MLHLLKKKTRSSKLTFSKDIFFKKRLLISVLAITIAGTVILVISKAAGPSASLEPESGAKSGVENVSDPKASGGSAIKFGAKLGGNGETTPICTVNPNIPKNHYLGASVDTLKVLPQSDTFINNIASHDFILGSTPKGFLKILGGRTAPANVFTGPARPSDYRYPGFPVNLIPSDYSMVYYSLGAYANLSDIAYYPYPATLDYMGKISDNGPIYDQYMLSLTSDCKSYESIGIQAIWGNVYASSVGGVIWDKNYTPHKSNYIDPTYGASNMPVAPDADATPLIPQIIRKSEVAAGSVNHVMHFYTTSCRNGQRILGESFIWPSRLSDCWGGAMDMNQIPYGSWLRLKASYPVPSDPGAATVVRALKKHGMVAGDGGGATGIAAEDLPVNTYTQLEQIPYSAFEVVDAQGLRANPNAQTNDFDYWNIK